MAVVAWSATGMPATTARVVRTKPAYLRPGHRIEFNGQVVEVIRHPVRYSATRWTITVAVDGYAETFTALSGGVLLRHI